MSGTKRAEKKSLAYKVVKINRVKEPNKKI